MAVELTLPPTLRRQYPHLEGMQDWRVAQSLRLLWDRYYDLEARLQAIESTVGDLVDTANRQQDQLTTVDRKAMEALASAQLVRPAGGGDGSNPGGIPTIPDYSAVVATVLARYNPVIPAGQEDEGKAQLTRAVAWEIYQTDPGIGLIQKLTGHQVAGLSTDKLVQQSNGDFADMASSHDNGDGTITIIGSWNRIAGDGSLIPTWTQPTAALADMAGPMALL